MSTITKCDGCGKEGDLMLLTVSRNFGTMSERREYDACSAPCLARIAVTIGDEMNSGASDRGRLA